MKRALWTSLPLQSKGNSSSLFIQPRLLLVPLVLTNLAPSSSVLSLADALHERSSNQSLDVVCPSVSWSPSASCTFHILALRLFLVMWSHNVLCDGSILAELFECREEGFLPWPTLSNTVYYDISFPHQSLDH